MRTTIVNAMKVLGALCMLLFLVQAEAHHSFVAEFDRNAQVDIQGYVTRIDWLNPHVHFYVDVKDPSTGKTVQWDIEMGPPHSLQERGWKRNTMQIGDEVRVVGWQAHNGKPYANAKAVTMVATGKELLAATSAKGSASSEESK